MRILFVATNLPIPPNSGQSIRSLSILRAFASSGHEVGFVSFASKTRPENLDPLPSFCRSIDLLDREMKNLTLQKDYFARLTCLLKFKCYSVERFRSAGMRERIQRKLDETKYDLIVCDGIHGLINIPKSAAPVLLNCHNVEYVILQRFAQLERNPLKRLYATWESYLLRAAECEGCGRSAAAMTCSQVDLEILQKLQRDLTLVVIPNVVDTHFIQPSASNGIENKGPILFFQGVMDWYPNRDAVEFFIQGVLPGVRATFPEVRFVIAGRNPPAAFVARFSSDPKIEFTGTVPDIRPYLASATVVVVPLRVAGGTRIKILEACAAGKPIVSTSVGAEGLDLDPNKEIVLADQPGDLARAIVELLRNPARREALSNAARTAVVQRYSPQSLQKALNDLLSSLRT